MSDDGKILVATWVGAEGGEAQSTYIFFHPLYTQHIQINNHSFSIDHITMANTIHTSIDKGMDHHDISSDGCSATDISILHPFNDDEGSSCRSDQTTVRVSNSTRRRVTTVRAGEDYLI